MLYTTLIAGFCAYVVDVHSQSYIAIGRIVMREPGCAMFLLVADKSTIPPLRDFDHAVHAEIDEFRGTLIFDDKTFVIPRERAL